MGQRILRYGLEVKDWLSLDEDRNEDLKAIGLSRFVGIGMAKRHVFAKHEPMIIVDTCTFFRQDICWYDSRIKRTGVTPAEARQKVDAFEKQLAAFNALSDANRAMRPAPDDRLASIYEKGLAALTAR